MKEDLTDFEAIREFGVSNIGRPNSFVEYKGIHEKKTGILFASGPTLSLFFYDLLQETNLVQVGVNSTVYNDELNLDYYFCGHDPKLSPAGIHEEGRPTYLKASALREIKTFCVTRVDGNIHPEHFSDEEVEAVGASPCCITQKQGLHAIHADIHNHKLYNESICFAALQFLLYTGVERIYLVGIDCGKGYSFIHPKIESTYSTANEQMIHWVHFDNFIKASYPSVKMISVNPKALAGLFEDIGVVDDKYQNLGEQ